jgi:hypothetical protein
MEELVLTGAPLAMKTLVSENGSRMLDEGCRFRECAATNSD